jgi:hypothetical protein
MALTMMSASVKPSACLPESPFFSSGCGHAFFGSRGHRRRFTLRAVAARLPFDG